MSARTLGGAAALACFLLVGGAPDHAARNGSIQGRVDLTRRTPVLERRPTVADLGAPVAREVTERPRSVVYLETAPTGAFEQNDGGRAVMDQRRETFVPHVLAITTGTTVEFPNSDRMCTREVVNPVDLSRVEFL